MFLLQCLSSFCCWIPLGAPSTGSHSAQHWYSRHERHKSAFHVEVWGNPFLKYLPTPLVHPLQCLHTHTYMCASTLTYVHMHMHTHCTCTLCAHSHMCSPTTHTHTHTHTHTQTLDKTHKSCCLLTNLTAYWPCSVNWDSVMVFQGGCLCMDYCRKIVLQYPWLHPCFVLSSFLHMGWYPSLRHVRSVLQLIICLSYTSCQTVHDVLTLLSLFVPPWFNLVAVEIFLHGCETKSGEGLGTRLTWVSVCYSGLDNAWWCVFPYGKAPSVCISMYQNFNCELHSLSLYNNADK